MKTNDTQKAIAKYLAELVNDIFGSVWVPLWAALHLQNAAAAIGIKANAGICDTENGMILVYID